MKRTQLILVIIYLAVTLYFALFNWDMFIVNLNISLGFGIVRIPLLVVLFIAGLALLLIEWAIVKIFSLKKEQELARKEGEITELKAVQFDNQLTEVRKNSASLEELHSKINLVMEKLDIEMNKKLKTQHSGESNRTLTAAEETLD